MRDRMAEHWDVSEDDWDTLFSTRILKKTGIRLDDRARQTQKRRDRAYAGP